jgi:hypothetical protein
MAATPAILDLVSIDFLTNSWVNMIFWWLIGVTGGRFLSICHGYASVSINIWYVMAMRRCP